VRSAPLGTPHTASRIRGSGCRRRAGAYHRSIGGGWGLTHKDLVGREQARQLTPQEGTVAHLENQGLGFTVTQARQTWDRDGATHHTETKKQSHNTGARANNILHQELGYSIGEPARQSACEARPLGTPHTASRIRGSGYRRRAGVSLTYLSGVVGG